MACQFYLLFLTFFGSRLPAAWWCNSLDILLLASILAYPLWVRYQGHPSRPGPF